MPRYRVTFRKVVYGSTGHAREICQRIVDVNAADSAAAEAAAIANFCNLENVSNWLHHADRLEIAKVGRVAAERSVRDGGARRAA